MGQTREPIMQALQARITGAIASSFTGNIANTGPGGVAQISAIADTSKIERVYSPVAERASAIGRKPATVTSVPDSIGNAVLA